CFSAPTPRSSHAGGTRPSSNGRPRRWPPLASPCPTRAPFSERTWSPFFPESFGGPWHYLNVHSRRRLRHPFYPDLKLVPASGATQRSAALCGDIEELCGAASIGVHVDRAVFPFCRPSSPFLTAPERDALWTMFQVPVYAVLIDPRVGLIGYECEAQRGMHIRDDYAAGLLFGQVVSSLCECGRPGPRIVPPEIAEDYLRAS